MNDDQRREQRFSERINAFVEMAGPVGPADTRVMICHSLDISANGLRVGVDHFIKPGSLRQLVLEIPERGDALHLVAEARWCRREPEGAYRVGFALLASDGTDYRRWQKLLAG